jgi:signal transduction histidine kinase
MSRTESDVKLLRRQVQRFQVLQRISQQLVSELDIDRLLHSILAAAIEVTEAQAGTLYLLDEETDELEFRVVVGGGGEQLVGRRMGRDQGIAGWVLGHQQAVIVDDTLRDKRHEMSISASVGYTTESMICAPLIDLNRTVGAQAVGGRAFGVLQILNKQNDERFDESDRELLMALAAQSAVALSNAHLYQQLRHESDRLISVEVDERKRLARNLHDGPTQIVAAVIMRLQFIRKLLTREPDMVDGELVEAGALAERAMRQLRTMLFELRPVVLETQGLIPALEAYASRLTETEHFVVHLDVQEGVPRLRKEAEAAIFAVAQEAIGNAKKYAQAENMWIEISLQMGRANVPYLQVNVRDDGQGFEVDTTLPEAEARGSLGMIHMRESAELLQGVLTLESTPGEGATVGLTVPLESNLQD